MFNHHDCVAEIHQSLEHVEQMPHVVEVQAGGGFIEQIKRLARLPFAQFFGQFDALRFAARESGGRLAQMNVAQAHLIQRFEFGVNLRDVFENAERFFHAGFEQVGDAVAFVFDL